MLLKKAEDGTLNVFQRNCAGVILGICLTRAVQTGKAGDWGKLLWVQWLGAAHFDQICHFDSASFSYI